MDGDKSKGSVPFFLSTDRRIGQTSVSPPAEPGAYLFELTEFGLKINESDPLIPLILLDPDLLICDP